MFTLSIIPKQFDEQVWQMNADFNEKQYNDWLKGAIKELECIYDIYNNGGESGEDEYIADIYILGDIINMLEKTKIKCGATSGEEDKDDDTNNKSGAEIIAQCETTDEAMRHYFSRLCFANNATECQPFELDIDIKGTMGLSESEKIKYLSVYEECDIIWFIVGGIWDENPQHVEFDDLSFDEKLHIIKELEHIM